MPSTTNEPRCPACGSWMIVVLKRAWCMQAGIVDGCGHFYPNWPSTKCSGGFPHGNCSTPDRDDPHRATVQGRQRRLL